MDLPDDFRYVKSTVGSLGQDSSAPCLFAAKQILSGPGKCELCTLCLAQESMSYCAKAVCSAELNLCTFKTLLTLQVPCALINTVWAMASTRQQQEMLSLIAWELAFLSAAI